MELWDWLGQNWFVLLQTAGIIGSLLFTAYTLRIDAKERRVANLFTLTEHHRDLWENLFSVPDLARIKDPSANLAEIPVTASEQLFVLLLVLHINAAYRAIRAGVLQSPEKLRRDLQTLFSLPIPKAVWEQVKQFQDAEFIRFVESARAD
jgi:hypothetical protein